MVKIIEKLWRKKNYFNKKKLICNFKRNFLSSHKHKPAKRKLSYRYRQTRTFTLGFFQVKNNREWRRVVTKKKKKRENLFP